MCQRRCRCSEHRLRKVKYLSCVKQQEYTIIQLNYANRSECSGNVTKYDSVWVHYEPKYLLQSHRSETCRIDELRKVHVLFIFTSFFCFFLVWKWVNACDSRILRNDSVGDTLTIQYVLSALKFVLSMRSCFRRPIDAEWAQSTMRWRKKRKARTRRSEIEN